MPYQATGKPASPSPISHDRSRLMGADTALLLVSPIHGSHHSLAVVKIFKREVVGT